MSEPEPHAPVWVASVHPDAIKDQRAKGWPDFHPEDFCHACGQRNPCWFSAKWNESIDPHGGGGILCPTCFIKRVDPDEQYIWRVEVNK